MPHNRFFTSDNLSTTSQVELSKEESQHLVSVMRVKENEMIELCDGLGHLAKAEVIKSDKKSTLVEIKELKSVERSRARITLILALMQPKNLDLAIEKCSELGVDRFILFEGQKSLKSELSPNQLIRLERLTVSSIKQSGRLWLPELEISPKLASWKPFEEKTLFGSLKEGASPPPREISSPLTFVVGPEAGFTQEEEERLSSLGAKPCSLNANILRAETAAICAAALLCCRQ